MQFNENMRLKMKLHQEASLHRFKKFCCIVIEQSHKYIKLLP